MIALLVMLTSFIVMTACAGIWVLLILRMWRDFRPSRRRAICGTVWVVLIIGTLSGLCGLGSYTLGIYAAAAVLDLM